MVHVVIAQNARMTMNNHQATLQAILERARCREFVTWACRKCIAFDICDNHDTGLQKFCVKILEGAAMELDKEK